MGSPFVALRLQDPGQADSRGPWTADEEEISVHPDGVDAPADGSQRGSQGQAQALPEGESTKGGLGPTDLRISCESAQNREALLWSPYRNGDLIFRYGELLNVTICTQMKEDFMNIACARVSVRSNLPN